jgi:hypothetical protein
MGTILDHNMTDEEFSILFGELYNRTTFEQTYHERSTDQINVHLYKLMTLRNDPRAETYFNLIKNPSTKFSLHQLGDVQIP